MNPFEFYETPEAFTRYLFSEVPIGGRVVEPCVGSGAIVSGATGVPVPPSIAPRVWVTNDIDTRWQSDSHEDAQDPAYWERLGDVDFVVTNPPFTPALAIAEHALRTARVGVAMHLRASIHEVLKTGERRTWMQRHPPTGILWLPRCAYQRSPTTGKWTTDSVCACWVIWLADKTRSQFIRYAPESVLDDLDRETPSYRSRMDALMAEWAA